MLLPIDQRRVDVIMKESKDPFITQADERVQIDDLPRNADVKKPIADFEEYMTIKPEDILKPTYYDYKKFDRSLKQYLRRSPSEASIREREGQHVPYSMLERALDDPLETTIKGGAHIATLLGAGITGAAEGTLYPLIPMTKHNWENWDSEKSAAENYSAQWVGGEWKGLRPEGDFFEPVSRIGAMNTAFDVFHTGWEILEGLSHITAEGASMLPVLGGIDAEKNREDFARFFGNFVHYHFTEKQIVRDITRLTQGDPYWVSTIMMHRFPDIKPTRDRSFRETATDIGHGIITADLLSKGRGRLHYTEKQVHDAVKELQAAYNKMKLSDHDRMYQQAIAEGLFGIYTDPLELYKEATHRPVGVLLDLFDAYEILKAPQFAGKIGRASKDLPDKMRKAVSRFKELQAENATKKRALQTKVDQLIKDGTLQPDAYRRLQEIGTRIQDEVKRGVEDIKYLLDPPDDSGGMAAATVGSGNVNDLLGIMDEAPEPDLSGTQNLIPEADARPSTQAYMRMSNTEEEINRLRGEIRTARAEMRRFQPGTPAHTQAQQRYQNLQDALEATESLARTDEANRIQQMSDADLANSANNVEIMSNEELIAYRDEILRRLEEGTTDSGLEAAENTFNLRIRDLRLETAESQRRWRNARETMAEDLGDSTREVYSDTGEPVDPTITFDFSNMTTQELQLMRRGAERRGFADQVTGIDAEIARRQRGEPREPTGDELMGPGHVDQQLQQIDSELNEIFNRWEQGGRDEWLASPEYNELVETVYNSLQQQFRQMNETQLRAEIDDYHRLLEEHADNEIQVASFLHQIDLVKQEMQRRGMSTSDLPTRQSSMRGATEGLENRPIDTDFFADMFPSEDEARRAAVEDTTPETTTPNYSTFTEDDFYDDIQSAVDEYEQLYNETPIDELPDIDEYFDKAMASMQEYANYLTKQIHDVPFDQMPDKFQDLLNEKLGMAFRTNDLQNFGYTHHIKKLVDETFIELDGERVVAFDGEPIHFRFNRERLSQNTPDVQGMSPSALSELHQTARRENNWHLVNIAQEEIRRRNNRSQREGASMEVDPSMYSNYGMEFMARQNPNAIDFAALSAEQFAELHQIAQRGNNTALLDALEQEASRRLAQDQRNTQRQAQQETTTQQGQLQLDDDFPTEPQSLIEINTDIESIQRQLAGEDQGWQGTRAELESILADLQRQRDSRRDRPDVLQGDTERSRSGFDTAEGRDAAARGTTTENRFDNTTEFPTPDSIMEALDGIMQQLEALTPSQTAQKRQLERQMAEAKAALQRRIPAGRGRGTRLNMGIDPTQLGPAARELWNNFRGWLQRTHARTRLNVNAPEMPTNAQDAQRIMDQNQGILDTYPQRLAGIPLRNTADVDRAYQDLTRRIIPIYENQDQLSRLYPSETTDTARTGDFADLSLEAVDDLYEAYLEILRGWTRGDTRYAEAVTELERILAYHGLDDAKWTDIIPEKAIDTKGLENDSALADQWKSETSTMLDNLNALAADKTARANEMSPGRRAERIDPQATPDADALPESEPLSALTPERLAELKADGQPIYFRVTDENDPIFGRLTTDFEQTRLLRGQRIRRTLPGSIHDTTSDKVYRDGIYVMDSLSDLADYLDKYPMAASQRLYIIRGDELPASVQAPFFNETIIKPNEVVMAIDISGESRANTVSALRGLPSDKRTLLQNIERKIKQIRVYANNMKRLRAEDGSDISEYGTNLIDTPLADGLETLKADIEQLGDESIKEVEAALSQGLARLQSEGITPQQIIDDVRQTIEQQRNPWGFERPPRRPRGGFSAGVRSLPGHFAETSSIRQAFSRAFDTMIATNQDLKATREITGAEKRRPDGLRLRASQQLYDTIGAWGESTEALLRETLTAAGETPTLERMKELFETMYGHIGGGTGQALIESISQLRFQFALAPELYSLYESLFDPLLENPMGFGLERMPITNTDEVIRRLIAGNRGRHPYNPTMRDIISEAAIEMRRDNENIFDENMGIIAQHRARREAREADNNIPGDATFRYGEHVRAQQEHSTVGYFIKMWHDVYTKLTEPTNTTLTTSQDFRDLTDAMIKDITEYANTVDSNDSVAQHLKHFTENLTEMSNALNTDLVYRLTKNIDKLVDSPNPKAIYNFFASMNKAETEIIFENLFTQKLLLDDPQLTQQQIQRGLRNAKSLEDFTPELRLQILRGYLVSKLLEDVMPGRVSASATKRTLNPNQLAQQLEADFGDERGVMIFGPQIWGALKEMRMTRRLKRVQTGKGRKEQVPLPRAAEVVVEAYNMFQDAAESSTARQRYIWRRDLANRKHIPDWTITQLLKAAGNRLYRTSPITRQATRKVERAKDRVPNSGILPFPTAPSINQIMNAR